jgi:microcystin-dependent protein
MSYPKDKPTGNYELRDYDFASNDSKKIPMDEYTFKMGYKNADESDLESVPDAHEQNWMFDILHRNLRYTKQVAEENKKQLETKLATPTSIGQVKIGYGLEITSNGVLSVVKDIAQDANIISYDLPVGSYMYWAGKNTPEYFIEPQGQTLLRSSYPDLWAFAQNNGLVGTLFGAGDGKTTFTVTDLRDRFVKSSSTIGTLQDAGLPQHTHNGTTSSDGTHTHTRGTMNITGSFGSGESDGSYTGAFYRDGNQDGNTQTGGSTDSKCVFDASRSWTGATSSNGAHTHTMTTGNASDAIYGKSTTVQPKNVSLKLILKALPTPPVNAVPVGTILDYTANSAPDGYIIANGAELSRTTFSKLYNWAVANNLIVDQASIPTTAHGFYGSGNGSTTFTIPDLRGVFKRGADLSSNRGGTTRGTYQADGLPALAHTHTFSGTTSSSGAHTHTAQSAGAHTHTVNYTGSDFDDGEYGDHIQINSRGTTYAKTLTAASAGAHTHTTTSSGAHTHTFSGTTATNSGVDGIYGKATSVQPKSVAVNYIIKY